MMGWKNVSLPIVLVKTEENHSKDVSKVRQAEMKRTWHIISVKWDLMTLNMSQSSPVTTSVLVVELSVF